MNFNKFLSISILFLISINFYQFLSVSNNYGQIAGKSTSSSTEVFLSIGEYRFTLFGYTSPQALVTFLGMGIFDQTYADNNGYFIFKNRFSPFSPREACLTAQDQLGRLSSPLCLPPFPTNYNVEIGPVIMPPTISLDKNNYYVGDRVILSGQTVPNTQVNLSMFTQTSPRIPLRDSPLFSLIKQVEAYSLPKIEIKSDEKGNFSITLPSSSPQTFRLFVKTNYLENSSPESRKLTLKILPWWLIVIQSFLMLFEIIKSRLLEFVILLQIIGLIIYFLRRYLHPKTLAIVRREKLAITLKNVEHQAKLRGNLLTQS